MSQKAQSAVSVSFPSTASANAFFGTSLVAFRSLFATILSEHLIGKSLTRKEDYGMFSYDVVERYPELETAYVATCPNRMDLTTMQKTVLKYVENFASFVAETQAENKKSSSHCTFASDFVQKISSLPFNDVSFRDLVISTAVARIGRGEMSVVTGEPNEISRSTSLAAGGSGATWKVQTRPKGKAATAEASAPSPATPALIAGAASSDPLGVPPKSLVQWFNAGFIEPTLAHLHRDVNLICDNCCAFNANNPDTSFVDAAQSLKRHAALAVADVGQRMQNLFAKWWKDSGVWRAVGFEVSKSEAAAVATTLPPAVVAPTTAATKNAHSATLLSTAAVSLSQENSGGPPIELLSSQATRRSISFTRKAVNPPPLPAAVDNNAPTTTTAISAPPPVTTESVAAMPPSPSLAPQSTRAPQPSIRETYPSGVVAATPAIPRPSPAVVAAAAASAPPHRIHFQRMAAFEETRRAEKRRLLDLLAAQQQQNGGIAAVTLATSNHTEGRGDSKSCLKKGGVAPAATSASSCPKSLVFAIPTATRVGMVTEHLRHKEMALSDAERCREEALRAVFGASNNSHKSEKENREQQQAKEKAAILFSVFADPVPPTEQATATNADNGEAKSLGRGSGSGSAIFASASANSRSALDTLSAFYAKAVAASSSATSKAALPSVSSQVLAAYSENALGELRELLTLLVGALHKSTMGTPVLFYGHELAEWYQREANTIVALAAASSSNTHSNPTASSPLGIGSSGSLLKRERCEEDDVVATEQQSGSRTAPSFWSARCFPNSTEAEACLSTARLLSTKVLVRMLLWFPHIVAACTRNASIANRNDRTTHGSRQSNDDSSSDSSAAVMVSEVIAGSVACPFVEQLLAFIDEEERPEDADKAK